jgi:hypothetical protein
MQRNRPIDSSPEIEASIRNISIILRYIPEIRHDADVQAMNWIGGWRFRNSESFRYLNPGVRL